MQLKTIAVAIASISLVAVSSTFLNLNNNGSGNFNILEIEEGLALLSMPFFIDKDESTITSEEESLELFRLAESLESKEEYSKALDLYEKIISNNHSEQLTWSARQNRAQIFILEDSPLEAIDEYTQFIETSRAGINQALAYSLRCRLNESLGRLDEAKLDRELLQTLKN